MSNAWLDFEKPVVELETRIKELREFTSSSNIEAGDELRRLEKKAERLRKDIYSKLSRWQRVQLARHPRRPYTLDYINSICSEFVELHGDRSYRDDRSIVGGLGKLKDLPIVILGHQKGRNTTENIDRNFGMSHPEGYRKALRLFHLADRFGLPVVTFVDTPGAYPGVGAEERGQSEAIAKNLEEMAGLRVPVVTVVIGEGGSGGALALAVADRVFMMENSVYSVISPEGCAGILWSDRSKAPEAAEVLRLTAQDILSLGVVDGLIPEPVGGAHRDPKQAMEAAGEQIRQALQELIPLDADTRIALRREKFLAMGVYGEDPSNSR